MDAETKARFEALTKTSEEHHSRFDKIDTTLTVMNKTLTCIQIKVASRDSWNWISKIFIAGAVGVLFYFFRSKL